MIFGNFTWHRLPCSSNSKEAMQETQAQSLGQEDPREKGIAVHSSILAWRIPWTVEPGKLQSVGSQRVRYDWVTNTTWHKGIKSSLKDVYVSYPVEMPCFPSSFCDKQLNLAMIFFERGRIKALWPSLKILCLELVEKQRFLGVSVAQWIALWISGDYIFLQKVSANIFYWNIGDVQYN